MCMVSSSMPTSGGKCAMYRVEGNGVDREHQVFAPLIPPVCLLTTLPRNVSMKAHISLLNGSHVECRSNQLHPGVQCKEDGRLTLKAYFFAWTAQQPKHSVEQHPNDTASYWRTHR